MLGRTVLITGAARGMGRVAAIELAAMGAHIILVDWEGEEGTRTRDAGRGHRLCINGRSTPIATRPGLPSGIGPNRCE